jgi:hypothetical protein
VPKIIDNDLWLPFALPTLGCETLATSASAS